jgi:TRAP-type mannitol/chloroaromatic compound transport system permease small subunit
MVPSSQPLTDKDRTMTWRMKQSASPLTIVDRIIAAASSVALLLVLPLVLLLFLQWPLREIFQAYSREANDSAQLCFALYVSVAITYASRERAHLAVDFFSQRYRERTQRRLNRFASLCVLIPWSAFVLYTGWPLSWQSIRQLEAFSETANPGYFVIKLAASLLVLLVLLQAIIETFEREASEST